MLHVLPPLKFAKVRDYAVVSLSGSGVNFINILRTAFTLVDPKSIKNTVKSKVSFYAFGIWVRKSCT